MQVLKKNSFSLLLTVLILPSLKDTEEFTAQNKNLKQQ